jgi:hypothetical protein
MKFTSGKSAFVSTLALLSLTSCFSNSSGQTRRMAQLSPEIQAAKGTCANPDIGRISLSVVKSALVLGESTSAQATVFDRNGSVMSGCQVSFSVSNTAVIAVSSTGALTAQVQGIGVGSASLLASKGGVKASASITVSQQSGTTTTTTSPPATTTTTVPSSGALPDLIVTSIQMNPSQPQSGQAVNFSAVVKNQGAGPTPAGVITGVLFSVDGMPTLWSDTYTAFIAPGATVTLTANSGPSGSSKWTAASGSHVIEAHADDINRYQESSESNNKLAVTVSVMASSPTTTTVSPTTTTTTPPVTGGFPDLSNTGVPAGIALTVFNGNMTISTPGAIIENMDIRGCVDVNASNVIIRKSRINCGSNGETAVYNVNATNLLIEDSELICNKTVGTRALNWRNYTARRVNAHGCDKIAWAEENVTIEDSYFWDVMNYNSTDDPHTVAIQIPAGGYNIKIRHNRLYGNYVNQSSFGTAAISIGGGTSNILVDSNILAGGGYTLYCDQEAHGGPSTNTTYTNNRFSRIFISTVGGFGPWTDCTDEYIVGNVYHETGQLLPGQ